MFTRVLVIRKNERKNGRRSDFASDDALVTRLSKFVKPRYSPSNFVKVVKFEQMSDICDSFHSQIVIINLIVVMCS